MSDDIFDEEDPPGFEWDPEEVVYAPIEDSIDLHTFQPREVKNLLHDYLEAACEKGFREVRIIHGKGTGVLRNKVQSILKNHPLVDSFITADPFRGGWGATVVSLKCEPGSPSEL